MVKGTGIYCTLDIYKNEKVFIDVIIFLYYIAIVHVYDFKIGLCYFKRLYRIYFVDVLSVNDLAIDLIINSITDSTISGI